MKQIYLKFSMLLLCMVMGLSSAWAEEVVYKTALFGKDYNSVGVSSYEKTFSSTNKEFTVDLTNFNNNNNIWSSVKCGRSSAASIATITTKSAIDKAITKVSISINSITATKVNSIKLYAGSSKTSLTYVGEFDGKTGDNTVSIKTPTANNYYEIKCDCAQGTSNGLIEISKIEFYYNNEGGATPSTPVNGDADIEIICKDVTWTSSGDQNTSSLSTTSGAYTINITKNTGTTVPVFVSTGEDVRTYAKATLTISSEKKQFTSVVFNISTQGLKRLAPITASCGTVATQASGDKTVIWTSSTPVSSVTFTVGDNANYGSDGGSKAGQLDFTSINITEASPTATITLNAACHDADGMVYGTYSNSSAWIVPEDLIVSEISIIDDALYVEKYNKGAIVPANTGVMVSATDGGNYTVNLSSESGSSVLGDDNCLRPSGDGITATAMAEADADCTYYRLTMHNGTQIGYWWGAEDGAAFALAANKAYLAVPNSVEVKSRLWMSEGATSISAPAINNTNNVIYNLNGQRVSNATKGLYIKNGQKYFVK